MRIGSDFLDHVADTIVTAGLILQDVAHDEDAAKGGTHVIMQVGGDFPANHVLLFQVPIPVQIDYEQNANNKRSQ